jgi:HK97 family phage portal protein
MGWFRRYFLDPDPTPAGVKAAEFHPDVYDTIRQLGWYCGTYGKMYRQQPAVRTVVDFLARNVAQLNAKVYERVSNTDRVEVWDHPVAELLRKPNPATTRYRHMFATVADMAIYDVAYWRIIRQPSRSAVIRISPEVLRPHDETLPNGQVRRVHRLSDGTIVPRNNLIIFPGYSPDNFDEGVSPLETLRRVLEEEAAAQQHRHGMWRNSARQSGWIQRPIEAPDWSDTARQRFRADVEAMMAGGANAGRIGVLEDGMTWNANSFSPKDTEYIAGRRLTYEEVAVVYGIDPSLFGLGSATKASSEQKHKEVYQDVLGPLLRQIQDELELQLLPLLQPVGNESTYIEFNIAEKLKGSFEEQATVLTTSAGVPAVAVNEVRARLNLPQIDDERFDIPVMPMNVMYGGQPAVTIPTADPSTPAVAALGPARWKAAPAAAERRRDQATKDHEELFRRFFARQEQAIVSAKAVKVDRERWDRELATDLYGLAAAVATRNGKIAARQLDGVYDEAVTLAYLSENARIAAESINLHTFDELDESDDPRHVFEVAKTSRADQLALGRATLLINFARTEAAKQSQRADGKERTKTWVVTSARSRHPEMNGETVPVSDNFSNGLAWPGDGHGGGAAQVAGCRCLLQLS